MKNVIKSIVSVLAVSAMCCNLTACNADIASSEAAPTTSQPHELHITLTDMSYDSENGILNAKLIYPTDVELIGLSEESVVLYGENEMPIGCKVETIVDEEAKSATIIFSDIEGTLKAFSITGGTGVDSDGCFVSSEVFEVK